MKQAIKDKAKAMGFDLIGITSAGPVSDKDVAHFKKWLANGYNGQMAWLENNIEKRFDPALLLPDAKSVICTAVNYKPTQKYSGSIASYALYQDYHSFIKEKLFALAAYIKEELFTELKFKACVDSAPIAERAFAARAGLGFIGKNHLLTNPELGSFLLLGELVTNIPLKPDEPIEQKDYCKDCNRCLDACPADAISNDIFFDANKCISYLTIEHEGQIANELQTKMNFSVFGCDKCIFACPYNEKSPACKHEDFKFSQTRANLTPQQILQMTNKDFDSIFADSAVSRTGLERLKRNALICMKNLSEF